MVDTITHSITQAGRSDRTDTILSIEAFELTPRVRFASNLIVNQSTQAVLKINSREPYFVHPAFARN